MTIEEIQYEAQGIMQEWGSNDSAPYMEFVEKLASMELPEPPSNLDEAAEKATEKYVYNDGGPFPHTTGVSFLNGFKAGAEWMAGQDRKIWNSSIRSVPEGNKSQILSFDAEGYFYLNRKPHPDSVEWCFAKELLPIRKKQ